MHNAAGMWFTFLALGSAYYIIRAREPTDLLVCARRTRLLDKHDLLFGHRRASLRVLAAAVVVSDARDRLQRRHARPGRGGERKLFLKARGRFESVRRSISPPLIYAGITFYLLGST